MKEIYKLKEDLLEFYRVAGWPLLMVTRIIIALFTIVIINLNMGAMAFIMKPTIILVVALIAGILPVSLGTVVIMCYTLGHVSAVSVVASAAVGGVLVLMYGFGKLFSPKETYLFAGAFIMCMLGGTYAVPMVLAMIGSMLGVVPVLGGVVWYVMLSVVSSTRNVLAESGATDAAFSVIESIQNDPGIILSLVAIGVSYVLAAAVKNMKINESWKLGVLLAAGANLLIVIIGSLFTSASIPFLGLFLGTFIGVLLGFIVEIFVHNVDYRGAQQLRFEDEEYVYFVKAIPKKDPPREMDPEDYIKSSPKEKRENNNRNGREGAKTQPQRSNTRNKKEMPHEKRAKERAKYKK